jgi:hypothetical protein
LGQAPAISPEASGLVGYHSQYQGTTEDPEEIPTDPELLRLRGEEKKDEEVHGILSWTIRKNYQLMIGIYLPIQDPVGGEFHEGQLWEEVTEDLIVSEKHAQMVYEWMKTRLIARSSQRMLPQGMPEMIDEVTVKTKRDGKAGYIWFTRIDSLAVPMKKMGVQVYIEYEYGYMKVWMGETYTIHMLAQEFWELTQRQWEIYPINGYRRTLDGSVVHKVTTDAKEYQAIAKQEAMVVAPVKVLEERGRGTEIHSLEDQGKLLQYWAWFQHPIEVGVLFPEVNHATEYWMNLTLQPVPEDDDPLTYLRVLKEMWMPRLRGISPGVAQKLETLGDDFGARVRYLCNGLRVWFAPNGSISSGMNRSLAEEPCSKDK